MFHNLIASISLFFATLLHPTQQHSEVKPQIHQEQKQQSFFEYTAQKTVQGILYVGEHRGIKTENVEKKYYLDNIEVEAQNCIVADFLPKAPIDITNKKKIAFTLTFANDCLTNRLVIQGNLIQENSVKDGGKTYKAKRVEKFGPVIVQNSKSVSPTAYTILLDSFDGNKEMMTDERKIIKYKIVDAQGYQIPSSQIQSIYIRTTDGEKLKIRDGNKYVDELKRESNLSSYGEIEVKSLDKPGRVLVILEATLRADKIILKKSASLALRIKELPDLFYSAKLVSDKDYFIVGKNSSLTYIITTKIYHKPIDPQKISSITFTTQGDTLRFFSPTGEKVKSLTLVGGDIQSSGLVIVSAEKEGLAKVRMEITFKPEVAQDSIVLEKTFSILQRAPINFVLEYVGTEYNETSGFFEDRYSVKVNSDDLNGKRVKIVAITPKILYPEVYYDKFIKGELDNIDNPFFCNIYYRDIYSQNAASLQGGEVSIFSVYDEKESTRPDLAQVNPIKDKLIILPNKFRNDTLYLGAWGIQTVLNSWSLQLAQHVDRDANGLSYVIGDETRYDPVEDTIAAILLDKSDGVYTIRNNLVQFTLTYPSFFAGKDVFFSVVYGDGKERVGNSYKRTLTGTKLDALQPTPCESKVCARKIKIYFPANNKPLQFSRFGVVCEGEKIRYLYFTHTKTSCVKDLAYGFTINQKTDGNGEVLMCIYPEPIYEEKTDQDTNQTYQVLTGYEKVTPRCTYQVAEEFPY